HIEELQARIVHAVLIDHIYESAFQRLACADLSESYMFLAVVSELLHALVEWRAVSVEFQVCFCPLGVLKLFIRFGAVTTIAASEQFQRRRSEERRVGKGWREGQAVLGDTCKDSISEHAIPVEGGEMHG